MLFLHRVFSYIMMNMRNIKSGNFNFKIHQGGQARLNFVKQNLGGQAMISSVLAIGGAILGATTIAGLLMAYQVRQAGDLAHSQGAIFAADAGVECCLYAVYKGGGSCTGQQSTITLENGASALVSCYDNSNNLTDCNSSAASALSVGTSINAKRAFLINF